MSIKLLIGPMFSGKSTELIRLVSREKIAGKKCIVIRHTIDSRNEGEFVTHGGQTKIDCDDIRTVKTLSELNDIIDAYEVVGVDEGQFFEDLAMCCDTWASSKQKKLIVAALDGDFNRCGFEQVINLIPLCEDVMKLHAVCGNCKNHSASFTRIRGSRDSRIQVGGAETYQSVCRKCYY